MAPIREDPWLAQGTPNHLVHNVGIVIKVSSARPLVGLTLGAGSLAQEDLRQCVVAEWRFVETSVELRCKCDAPRLAVWATSGQHGEARRPVGRPSSTEIPRETSNIFARLKTSGSPSNRRSLHATWTLAPIVSQVSQVSQVSLSLVASWKRAPSITSGSVLSTYVALVTNATSFDVLTNTTHQQIIMSGKLDQSLDAIMSDRKTTNPKRGGKSGRPTRSAATRTKAAVAAPVGGVQKNTRAPKGAPKAPAVTAPARGDSKIMVSNLPEDISEGTLKVR
nr:hypothetical protein CFP56_12260 [Quercus suber]